MTYLPTTICAISTAQGVGAIALIRISGPQAIAISNNCFKGKDLKKVSSHTLHLGTFYEPKKETIDQVIIGVYKAPNSYTGEDIVEISTHGATFIQQKVMQVLIKEGAELAKPGEFTFRAFLNKKLDLSQAEAVADLINAKNQAALNLALKQIRGGVSKSIKNIRKELVKFASLIELELDFSEEDVAFASRKDITQLLGKLAVQITTLLASFETGNAIKNGIPVAIIGTPNVGKSTLLNALLKEEKAIVSPIPGTTRDAIEDSIIIKNTEFRFVDTAGLRKTNNEIELIGIKKTHEIIKKSMLIICLLDVQDTSLNELKQTIKNISALLSKNQKLLIGFNKIDLQPVSSALTSYLKKEEMPYFSCCAKNGTLLQELKTQLYDLTLSSKEDHQVMLTNIRHFEALKNTLKALKRVEQGIKQDTYTDLLASDIKQMIFHLSEITGNISNEDILDSIFSEFCIGK